MRNLLTKKLPEGVEAKTRIIQLKADAITADGTIEGYGSVFGNTDSYGDIVMPGAFSASLVKAGRMPVALLWQHDPGEPIGVWDELREDNYGLKCRGRILDTTRGREALTLMRAGAPFGLSIGYECSRYETDENQRDKYGWPVRKLLECDLWEVSVVTFPANDAARIESVKRADAPPLVMPDQIRAARLAVARASIAARL